MKRVVFYGIGKVAEYFRKKSCGEIEIVSAIQTKKDTDKWQGIPVYELGELNELYDELWLTNGDIKTMDNALKTGIKKDKLVICNKVMCEMYCRQNKGVLDVKYMSTAAEEYERALEYQNRIIRTTTMERFLPVSFFVKDSDGELSNIEYVRYATLELLVEELKNKNVQGNLAELGVYRGDFSACLNHAFPDRNLYLFDTFEGFEQTDVDIELSNSFTSGEHAFKGQFEDTSVDIVLQKMKTPGNCVICKGYFPDTIPEEDLNYSLVSLDCDLYKPMKEGLRYFYPRLETGGYIVIHDYNNNGRWLGIKKALQECEEEFGHICRVPIPDRAGSVIITK